MGMHKSEWVPASCEEVSHPAIRSWFSPLCDDMTPTEAAILVDYVTDREKKIRALMIDKDGKKFWAIRSKNKGGYSITLKPIETRP